MYVTNILIYIAFLREIKIKFKNIVNMQETVLGTQCLSTSYKKE